MKKIIAQKDSTLGNTAMLRKTIGNRFKTGKKKKTLRVETYL